MASKFTRLRRVQAHQQGERRFGHRKPVRLLLSAWRVRLNEKVERAVAVGDQLVAVTDRQPIKRVGDEIAISVVSSHRPERIDRREFAFVEMQDIPILPWRGRNPDKNWPGLKFVNVRLFADVR
jgi:hypothetical protein